MATVTAMTTPRANPAHAPKSVGKGCAVVGVRASTQRCRRWPAMQVIKADMTTPAAIHSEYAQLKDSGSAIERPLYHGRRESETFLQ